MWRRLIIGGIMAALNHLAVLAAEPVATNGVPAFDPVSAYREHSLVGWRVLVNEKLLAETNLCARTLKHLTTQLDQIERVVPAGPLAKLRQIPIWVERSSPQFACMCYHESQEWLRTHGVNPEKTGGVELANPESFLSWTHDQPWMVLHELAHGYHARFLGITHAGILQHYAQAKAGGTYDSVLHIQGRKERHYALNNEKEYFAEATEAFFGTNDFFPFVRAELKEHDLGMFDLLGEIWEVTPRKKSPRPAAPTSTAQKPAK